MLYNILGDTHARIAWQKLVREDCINIFVGDYFAPYHNISLKDQLDNFQKIVEYKRQHPDTILLIGNHDIDFWYVNEKYSRYNALYYNDIYNILETNKNLLQVAYSIENKVLVTHAGASVLWYERNKDVKRKQFIMRVDLNYYNDLKTIEEADNKHIMQMRANTFLNNIGQNYYKIIEWKDNYWFYDYTTKKYSKLLNEYTPDNIANFINNAWENKKYSLFNFVNNANINDYYGTSETHGPMWIRPESLMNANIFKYTDYWQVVGHTMVNEPTINENEKIVFCDCLEYNVASVIFDSGNNNLFIYKK